MTETNEATLLLNPVVQEQLKEKGKDAYSKAKSYLQKLLDGGTSIRSFAILVSIALVADSCLGLVSHLTSFDLRDAVIDIYIAAIGLTTFVMESDKAAIPYSDTIRGFIEDQASFVQNVVGRGILYIAVGILELCQHDIISLVLGTTMTVVGGAYVFLGRSAKAKVAEIRSQKLSEGQLRHNFNKADTNGAGEIDCNEFHKLLNEIGAKINVKEAEMLFIPLDHDYDHGLSFEEFKSFWNEGERNH